MTESRVDVLRKARGIPQVTLQKYNQLRSRCAGKLICAFEGHEDVAFYDTAISRVKFSATFVPFVCKGKDQVLGLREILARNVSADASLIRYFVDHDFDGLKGQLPGDDIYCTPCYAIENFLIGEFVLNHLLKGEFKCNDLDAEDEIGRVVGVYKERWGEFAVAMREVNRLIFFARRSGTHLRDIDDDLKKYVSVTLDEVKVIVDREKICELLGFDRVPSHEEVQAAEGAFALLNPEVDWRGKFSFSFFKKVLSELKEDRGRKSPSFFSKRAVVSFSPGADITRALASIIAIPTCLQEFILAFPS